MEIDDMQHSELVRNLVKPESEVADEMSAADAGLIHMIMGVSGECGELLDAIKKHVIYGKPLDHENVLEELGDIEFYLEGFRQCLDITREETLEHNIAKLSKRYSGGKFTNSDAIERADKSRNNQQA